MSKFKDKAERVRDAIGVLRNLQVAGIPSTDSSYLLTKQILDAWIADGEPRQEKIQFPLAQRVGHLMLPRLAGRAVQFVLRASEELIEEEARKSRVRGDQE
jgi:hypothetical protein